MGNLTRDPELKYTPNGQAVASFGIATNRRWTTPEGDRREEAEFHNMVVWGRQAEVINQYLKKGQPIFVEGRLKTNNWEGADGIKRSRTEIILESFQFIGSKEGASQYTQPNQPPPQTPYNPAASAPGANPPDATGTTDTSGSMSSPAQTANEVPSAPVSYSEEPAPSNPADNPKNTGPNLGDPEDISIDDIPF
ncbi:single-stranded DNA-binding protein [Patescibacteria group bacterium]|nr:single-stranded DNA-binding protein [Patescibacteria group bacterium]